MSGVLRKIGDAWPSGVKRACTMMFIRVPPPLAFSSPNVRPVTSISVAHASESWQAATTSGTNALSASVNDVSGFCFETRLCSETSSFRDVVGPLDAGLFAVDVADLRDVHRSLRALGVPLYPAGWKPPVPLGVNMPG
jgi:hypothetical protein